MPRDTTSARLRELMEDPEDLEQLYRQDPQAFREALQEVARVDPESLVVRVWRARLEYHEPRLRGAWRPKLTRALAIALVFGALVRLPAIWLGEEWYYPRLAPSLVVLSLAVYFWIETRARDRLWTASTLTFVAVVYAALLPGEGDSVVMALLHLPILFWALLGLVFTGEAWRDSTARIGFVRYNGELVVLASLVALGGMVFSVVTVSLFELIYEDPAEMYFQNVGVFGAVAVPMAGTYLYDVVFGRRTGIASVLARIFAPLFLVMAVVYLGLAFLGGQNPFVDRDFLITFNALLLLVLGISVFSIVERAETAPVGAFDYVTLALVVVTLLMDAIALSAIVFRTASFGFTPNRVAVLGANLAILAHLAWMCWSYVGVVRGSTGFEPMRRVVARYLPVYVAWAALVVFLLPLVFGFA